ncbi:MAG: universal stress protein [Chloroflexi bacterium]|nr:universal stress protein [Chloroflexota bacterium]MBI3761908.1 universal stress protein [Chloroflexota bacterium]
MFKKILVTLDGSEFSERALKPAFQIAEKFDSEVTLLRVAMAQQYVTMPAGTGTLYPDPALERDREEAEAYLRAIKTQWLAARVSVHTEIIAGLPAEMILDVADVDGIDLIVMSTHGRSGLSRLLYGSVAESVLRGAQVPVLLIPIKH